MKIEVTSASTAAIAVARILPAHEHLRPLYEAARDYGVGLLTVVQDRCRFRAFSDRPTILCIGDDTDRSLGPEAFCQRSIRRFAAQANGAAIVACEPVWKAYAAVATGAAIERHHMILVETQPEHEIAWINVLRGANPALCVLLATVKGAVQ